jgi:hypothetical protein
MVGDEQTLALKRLADIFKGVTRSHTSRVVIPTAETVGNDAPPRVQNTATPQRTAHQTASSLLTPSSHRRPHIPQRRAVTPPTPHVMVRRSASHKYIFLQDVIAETINQATHCLSFTTSPSTKTKKGYQE